MTDAASPSPHYTPPPLTCDCHFHVFGPYDRFPPHPERPYDPPPAPLEALEQLHRTLGIDRGVVVQAGIYGHDNTALVDALTRSTGRMRGIAVLPADAHDEELQRLDAVGVRGLRINPRFTIGVGLGHVTRLADRLAPMAWHLQFLLWPKEVRAEADRLLDLPVPAVIDHIGLIEAGSEDFRSTLDTLCRLLDSGRVWIKISNSFKTDPAGPPWDAALPVVRELLAVAPDRLVWGTDWPHPSEGDHPPDDVAVMDLFARTVPDEALRWRILVENPQVLYGFPAS